MVTPSPPMCTQVQSHTPTHTSSHTHTYTVHNTHSQFSITRFEWCFFLASKHGYNAIGNVLFYLLIKRIISWLVFEIKGPSKILADEQKPHFSRTL